MLRDAKQRLAPVALRRWALRCGGGLLLGAGICAAAAGTAHAEAPGLTGKTLDLVARTAPAGTPSGTSSSAGTTSAGSAPTIADPTPVITKPAEAEQESPATRIVQVPRPKPAHVGRHRAAPSPEPVTDGVTRRPGTVLAGVGDTARKVSGRLGDITGGTASGRHHARNGTPADAVTTAPAAGIPDPAAKLLPRPQVPAAPLPPMPTIQLPGHPLQLPGVTVPGAPSSSSRDGLAGLLPRLLAGPKADLPDLSGAIPALGLPALPVVELPVVALPLGGLPLAGLPLAGLPLAGLPLGGLPVGGLPVGGLPVGGLPVGGLPKPGQPSASDPVAAAPGLTGGSTSLNLAAQQGQAGTASDRLSRVAAPVAPAAPAEPAAPRGPRPTGPVPAIPAGTGAGAGPVLTTAWAEPAAMTELTPSGRGIPTVGFAGLAPRDRAGMPSITPD